MTPPTLCSSKEYYVITTLYNLLKDSLFYRPSQIQIVRNIVHVTNSNNKLYKVEFFIFSNIAKFGCGWL